MCNDTEKQARDWIQDAISEKSNYNQIKSASWSRSRQFEPTLLAPNRFSHFERSERAILSLQKFKYLYRAEATFGSLISLSLGQLPILSISLCVEIWTDGLVSLFAHRDKLKTFYDLIYFFRLGLFFLRVSRYSFVMAHPSVRLVNLITFSLFTHEKKALQKRFAKNGLDAHSIFLY